jgi:hypothetical protein
VQLALAATYSGEKKYAEARTELAKVVTLPTAKPADKIKAQMSIAASYAENNVADAKAESAKIATMEGATDVQKAAADKQIKALDKAPK